VNAGTQILSGSNQFLGAITVSNGTLQIDGNTVSSSLATVASGGVLSGTGTVSALQVDGGGTLSPGSPVGTLTVTGAAALGNGALYAWDYNGAPNDKVTANSVSFNTAWSLSVNALAPWSDGVYTLFSTSGGVSGFVTPTITGISGATGVVSVAGNDVVLTISGSVGLTPFQTWQTNYFGPGGTSDPRAAFGADPDGDGANNLLEYAFGSVPTSGSSLILPESGTSGSFLTITVPRNVDATDITYLVQGGTDLLTWATLDTLTATSPAPGGTTVTYTNATAFDAVPAQFLRVKVTQP
jgi:autotransporter-associated beta strand protein